MRHVHRAQAREHGLRRDLVGHDGDVLVRRALALGNRDHLAAHGLVLRRPGNGGGAPRQHSPSDAPLPSPLPFGRSPARREQLSGCPTTLRRAVAAPALGAREDGRRSIRGGRGSQLCCGRRSPRRCAPRPHRSHRRATGSSRRARRARGRKRRAPAWARARRKDRESARADALSAGAHMREMRRWYCESETGRASSVCALTDKITGVSGLPRSPPTRTDVEAMHRAREAAPRRVPPPGDRARSQVLRGRRASHALPVPPVARARQHRGRGRAIATWPRPSDSNAPRDARARPRRIRARASASAPASSSRVRASPASLERSRGQSRGDAVSGTRRFRYGAAAPFRSAAAR